VGVGGHDPLRPFEVGVTGRIDLVARVHLGGVQHPLAVVAEGGAQLGRAPEAFHVADRHVRTVDRLQPVGPGGHQDRHQDVVERVGGIADGLGADVEAGHAHARHEVAGPEDEAGQPRAGGGDLVDVQQADRVLDLHLELDPAHRQAGGVLDLGEQQVERLHLGCRSRLGQHERVEVRPGPGDHLDHVGVGPRGLPPVHPDGHQGRGERAGVERVHDPLTGLRLDRRGDRVLKVEEERVDAEVASLGDEAVGGTRDGEDGPASGGGAGGGHGSSLGRRTSVASKSSPTQTNPTASSSARA